jgi:hypothetical protein
MVVSFFVIIALYSTARLLQLAAQSCRFIDFPHKTDASVDVLCFGLSN